MKNKVRSISMILAMTMLFASCKGETRYGKCIGIVDDGKPELQYELNGWNLFLGIVFIETIIVPILWATDYAKCPVGYKPLLKDKDV